MSHFSVPVSPAKLSWTERQSSYKGYVNFIQPIQVASLLQEKKINKSNTTFLGTYSAPSLSCSLCSCLLGKTPISACPYIFHFYQVPGSTLCCATSLKLHASPQSVLTFTRLRGMSEEVPRWAGAGVAPRNVPAQAVITQQPAHQALVNICGREERRQEKRTSALNSTRSFFHCEKLTVTLLLHSSDSEIKQDGILYYHYIFAFQ